MYEVISYVAFLFKAIGLLQKDVQGKNAKFDELLKQIMSCPCRKRMEAEE